MTHNTVSLYRAVQLYTTEKRVIHMTVSQGKAKAIQFSFKREYFDLLVAYPFLRENNFTLSQGEGRLFILVKLAL